LQLTMKVVLLGVGSQLIIWAQPPVINDIVDAGGYTAGIAPGGLFVAQGQNLCKSPAQATLPYQTGPLGGVTIQFTPVGGGASVFAYMESAYCVNGKTQLAAVLPSTLTPGNYNVVVTDDNLTGPAFQTTVVATKFGLMTLPGSGSGRGLVQNAVTQAQYDLNGFTTGPVAGVSFQRSPATPGEYLIIWGMGLGAAPGYDASAPTSGMNFLSQGLSVNVIVGGMSITPTYAGRSNLYPGLDNVIFQLPSNVPTGCAVPLQVQAAGQVSNLAYIAIAPAGGADCLSQVFNTSALTRLDQGGTATVGLFSLVGSPSANAADVTGDFAQVNADQLSQAELPFPSPGSCQVTPTSNSSPLLPRGQAVLDAGMISLNGPGIPNQAIPQASDNTYGTGFPSDVVSAGGSYTLFAAGGKDIGSFTVSTVADAGVTLTAPLPTTVNRAQGLTISWTSAPAGDVVLVFGASSAPTLTASNTMAFVCSALASQGSITVPGTILSLLPATPSSPDQANEIYVVSQPQAIGKNTFAAPLVGGGTADFARFIASVGASGPVVWQ
jgi:uncharacterized protein (TIGR03437 family)